MTNYRKAVDKGLLKILSKMGISLLTSYHGAQIFEALGIADNVIMSAFKGTSPPGSTCARSPSSIPSLPHRYHLHRSFSPHRHDIITLSSPLSSPPHLPTTLLILILILPLLPHHPPYPLPHPHPPFPPPHPSSCLVLSRRHPLPCVRHDLR